MTRQELLKRVVSDPIVFGGRPCIKGTRIDVAIILDGLSEGLDTTQLIDHYPSLTPDDVRAAVAYAAELARESIWRVSSGEAQAG